MLSLLAYGACLYWLARRAGVVRAMADILAIAWAAQILCWSVTESVSIPFYMAVDIATGVALIVLIGTRLAIILALFSVASILAYVWHWLAGTAPDTAITFISWAQMLALIGGAGGGLGRVKRKIPPADHRRVWNRSDFYARLYSVGEGEKGAGS